ncbi:MAG: D-tyrosyl-tRNA(Tyr) deacylase [Bifidobacteriaceae bacterium]|jgi:D-tyrosyl-tRNA(Tyr) deacylase|nr:D-tyrosyl-tRNA(Tyr) deacylase [Bifidobacteriaceae bacterium]
MRAVIQRADGAQVAVDGQVTGAFTGPGLVVLLGVTHGDGEEQAQRMARKIAELKLLRGEQGAQEAGAPVLLISQFTLYADTKKGRRPSWSHAAPGPVAEPWVERVGTLLEERGLTVARGVFGADMRVSLVNDGPVTLVVEA